MILYAALRSIRPLCVPTDMDKEAGVLSGNFEGTCLPKELGYDPGKDVKGNSSWRSTCTTTLMHCNTAITAAKVLWSPRLYIRPYQIL